MSVLAAAPPTLTALASVSVPFVANQGQVDDRVAFYARTFAATVFVTRQGQVVYVLAGNGDNAGGAAASGWTFSETLVGATDTPVGSVTSPARVSSFVSGPRISQVADLPTFERVSLGEIAPGVSAELRATGSNVEKLFHVAAGRDVERIRVQVSGANRLSLREDGGLVMGTGLGDIEFTAPLAYQEREGKRTQIHAAYTLASNSVEYGFALGDYDRSLPLTIDPLIRSTYSGGGLSDVVRAMLIHPGSGNVYVAGSTMSTNFPGTPSGAQPNLSAQTDAFVAQYSFNLGTLIRATYYGGAGNDSANAIALFPSSGDVYIAGTTNSISLPVGLSTGWQSAPGGGAGTDAFVARFDGALTSLLSATYYGATGADTGFGLAVDNISGDVVLVGDTLSTNLNLGTGGQQTVAGANGDAYIARFNASLSTLTRATYFGGSGSDKALAVAVDPITTDIFVAGVTTSTDLPGTLNGALSGNAGSNNGFVARFNSSLMALNQSTYFGGTGSDQITAIGVHPINGQIYVTGDTNSTDLRGKLSGQVSLGGGIGIDAFVARFVPELTGLLSVTYFGGSGDDFGKALALDKYTGEVYIAGQSNSSTLPSGASAAQATNSGGIDAFVARFDRGLTSVKQSTFLGSSLTDIANAIALNQTDAYVAGETGSATFPGTSIQSAQLNPGGGTNDGFISYMTADLRLVNSSPAPFTFTPAVNALPSTVQTSAPTLVSPTGDASGYVDGQPGSKWCASTTAACTCNLTGGTFTAGSFQLPAGTPYYVCVQQTASAAPNVITEAILHIGAEAATFRVGTGTIAGFGCTLDVDGNGSQGALTDGLLIIRALFGLTGTSVTNGAVGAGAARTAWSDISAYFNTNCGGNFAP
ncbi:MAG: SBBP repeat-containing protein [Betaproteobacteria bacterium]